MEMEEETKTLNFLGLPHDVIFYILKYLEPYDLVHFALASKECLRLFNQDILWRHLYFLSIETPEFTSEQDAALQKELAKFETHPWKNLYRQSKEWRWDETTKPSVLSLTNHNLTVTRPLDEGINPLVQTTLPFTRYRNHIEFQIHEVGVWFRVGIADKLVKRIGGSLIGDQDRCWNIGYCRTGHIYVSKYCKGIKRGTPVQDPSSIRIVPGTIISIQWDHEHSSFHFFHNGVRFQSFEIDTAVQPVEKTLYPTMQISFRSQSSIRTGNVALLGDFLSTTTEKPHPPMLYERELATLEEMGFANRMQNLQVLQQTGGNIDNSVAILIANKEKT